ncbi:hypothetical protein Acr_00g0035480 [Actinidia rufa]|uniref:Transposase (putative) gypsy type domain-containing protein n=1 Tax=Actinidia rufa TaxID=165716 RepID=A0A7J0DGR8_9ERIC|nr:hypothetical protein Acr_00g0035480 [Actinidia rufa]
MERYLGDVGDIIGKIAIWRDSGRFWWRSIKPSILPRPKARRRQHFGSGRAQMSTLMVALASSMERTWRGSMDSFYLGQEGSEIKFGVLNAMGLRRMNVRRCSVPLGASDLPCLRDSSLVTSPRLWPKRPQLLLRRVLFSRKDPRLLVKGPLDDGSKGKQVAQSPEPKKARIDTGASRAPAKPPVASGAGSSAHRTLGEALGPQASVMASAATAEKILAGVILPADKEKVDKLTFDQVVTNAVILILFVAGVILGSSLAVRSRDFAESALNQKAVAESAEMEMVRAQNRAIELEGALAEEKAKGKKLAEDADARSKVIAKLEARISELEKSQSLTQGRIIAAFKESDDFLEAVKGSTSSYFGDGFDFCKRQLAHHIHGENGRSKLSIPIMVGCPVCMFTKINLGGEESEQSLPSWISDHLGAKSYIDETSQSPSSPPPNSPKMDTSSLTKEGNVMTQAELDKLGSTYSFPSGIRLRIPGDGETILSARQGEVAFYEAAFQAGLRLPIHPTIREILVHYKICPAQLSPNAWRSVICSLVIWRHFKRHMSCDEFRCLYSLSPLPDSGWFYFKARPDKNLLRGSPSNVKGWKTRFFFASGDEWEFPSGTARQQYSASSQILENASCKKLPTLSEVDAKRTEEVLGKIEPGGYFEVSKVLGSRTFQKHFAAGCTALSTSGGDNTASGEEGEFITREGSVEYLGVIRRDIGGVIRRAHPGIPDETLLRWLEGKVKDPFMNLLSGTSGSSLDSGSVSTSDSELPPELRSDAMSARGKAKAEKATKTTAKPPTKGVVIREKRTREGDPLIKIGEPDAFKGERSCAAPPPKRFKSNRGAINARGRAAGRGPPPMVAIVGSESMSDASVARKLLTGVVVFASSLALRSQENLHEIDFQMARADLPSWNWMLGSQFLKATQGRGDLGGLPVQKRISPSPFSVQHTPYASPFATPTFCSSPALVLSPGRAPQLSDKNGLKAHLCHKLEKQMPAELQKLWSYAGNLGSRRVHADASELD